MNVFVNNSNSTKSRKKQETMKKSSWSLASLRPEMDPWTQCVIGGDVLAKDRLERSEMQRHLQSLNRESLVFFKWKLSVKAAALSDGALQASLVFSHWIEKAGKPHVFHFLPRAKEIVSVVCGKSAAVQLAPTPVSNETVVIVLHIRHQMWKSPTLCPICCLRTN